LQLENCKILRYRSDIRVLTNKSDRLCFLLKNMKEEQRCRTRIPMVLQNWQNSYQYEKENLAFISNLSLSCKNQFYKISFFTDRCLRWAPLVFAPYVICDIKVIQSCIRLNPNYEILEAMSISAKATEIILCLSKNSSTLEQIEEVSPSI
jgi:hypothetical protein